MRYAAEMPSCGMKIGAGVHAILRFCVRNLRHCNVGITDGSYDQKGCVTMKF
jgi:hypothetical protein